MTDVVLAAGAVVWRLGPGGVEILLVHRPKYDDWSLPKGKREPGEHILLTAVREVFEETRVCSVLGPRLPSVEYEAGDFRKQVDYWSVLSPGHQAAACHEVDAVSWRPRPQAIQQLTYSRDADLIAGARLRETVPLILLRHASAGQKGSWPARCQGQDGRSGTDGAAVLLRAERAGAQLAGVALHRDRAPLRRGFRWGRGG
jgi:8-oxo-dGTP diphosphatase